MSLRKKVLAIGLTKPTKNHSKEQRQEAGTEEELHQKLASMVAAARNAGYDFHLKLFSPDELDEAVEQTRQLLEQEEWDAFVVGFGIRGEPGLTEYFEKLVNAAREIRPEAKMGFNTKPLDLFETVKRLGLEMLGATSEVYGS